MLIVCNPHVIIFSEKSIKWPDKPLEIAWPRWFRKAVLDGAKQIAGAERWIATEPGRIFLDSKCTVPFPLNFPEHGEMKVHRVVVARGAAAACQEYFQGGSGSLVVEPPVVGHAHFSHPFAIGDLDPNAGFVHVFDEVALEVLLDELDTIADFTNYLEKRAAFIRSGHLGMAHGEEDLFAYYAVRLNEDGDHDFTPPEGNSWERFDFPVMLDGSHWKGMALNPQYRAKKDADRISYAWDRLIGIFTRPLLNGTSIVLEGHSYDLKNSEQALRFMALEDRVSRRSHAKAIIDALEIGVTRDVFFRAMISSAKTKGAETGFFILTLKYPEFLDDKGGYEQYRLVRTKYLEVYAIGMLRKHPDLKRIIGVAMEPPNQGRGSSEDNIYVEQQDWDDETIRENEEAAKVLGIMQALRPFAIHEDEFPNLPSRSKPFRPTRPRTGGNRKQRRALAAKARKDR